MRPLQGEGTSTTALSVNGNERLIGNDVVTFIYKPGHDLRFLEPLAEIGQIELPHRALLQPN